MATVYMQDAGGFVFITSNPEYHKSAKKLTAKAGKELHRAQRVEILRNLIKPGQTVYTQIVSVSKTGMSRVIRLHIVDDGKIVGITGYAATVLGWSGDADGLKVTGCGMDMGFHTVYCLGQSLWPQGTPEPHGSRNGAPDSSGGYALKHEWL